MSETARQGAISIEPLPPERRLNEQPEGVLVVVPLYRSAGLLPDLVDALLDCATELREANATVLFFNDSPDDAPLEQGLHEAVRRLRGAVSIERLANSRNLGFVQTANRGMELALAADRDVILLNSDALPRPGAFRELLAVAYSDPLIGVVSPRSDNATLCNSPVPESWRGMSRDAAYDAHRSIQHHLPRVSYAPTAVGFCLLVRRAMLAEFGFFDPVYGAGYNEENDLIRRLNQHGYRAAIANHAFVHHLGGVSFAQTDVASRDRDRVNHALLVERYPEYETIVRRYFDGAEMQAERMLAGLIPVAGKLRILFDCRVLGEFFNGTFEHLRCLLSAFARRYGETYDIALLCDEAAFAFHRLGEIPGVVHRDLETALRDPAAIAFQLSQPSEESVHTLASLGAVVGAFMLDTIAMDCQQLDLADFRGLWQDAADDLDMVGFNSAFSHDQFNRRFSVSTNVVQFVSSCSTDVSEYRQGTGDRIGGGGILLIGNHYPHKHMVATCRALHAVGSTIPVVAFGVQLDEPGVVASYVAGHIPETVVEGLYRDADIVLFPSHYEGFGLPIMHALAYGVPVIARDIPCAREIKANCPQSANLHLCASTDEMVALAVDPPRWIDAITDAASYGWDDAADDLASAFTAAMERFTFDRCRRRQTRALHRRSGPAPGGFVGGFVEASRRIASLEKGISFAHDEMAHLREAYDAAQKRAGESEKRALNAEARQAEARAAELTAIRNLADARTALVQADAVADVYLDAALAATTAPGAAKGRSSREYGIDEPVAPLAGGEVRLRAPVLAIESLRERLVVWARALAPGQAIRLSLPRVIVDAGNTPIRFVTAMMAVAGCTLIGEVRIGFRMIVATGIRVEPVMPTLDDCDDGLFLEVAYRLLLGRVPDAEGRAHYRLLLARGLAREALIDTLASSDERWSNICARLSL